MRGLGRLGHGQFGPTQRALWQITLYVDLVFTASQVDDRPGELFQAHWALHIKCRTLLMNGSNAPKTLKQRLKTLKNNENSITIEKLLKLFTGAHNKINNVPAPSGGRPKLIIRYGPPASGKTRLLETVKTNLGINDPPNSFIKIDVDSIVESLQYFKQHTRNIANRFIFKGVTNKSKLMNELNRITPLQTVQIKNAYFRTRKAKNSSKKTISSKDTLIMEMAIEKGKNLTIETTKADFGWVFDKFGPQLEHHNYIIIVAFPIPPFEELWKRYRERAINSYLSGGPFRFFSTKSSLNNAYTKSKKDFVSIFTKPTYMRYINHIVIKRPNRPTLLINRNQNLSLKRGVVREYLDLIGTPPQQKHRKSLNVGPRPTTSVRRRLVFNSPPTTPPRAPISSSPKGASPGTVAQMKKFFGRDRLH